jgi:hypothetical protein
MFDLLMLVSASEPCTGVCDRLNPIASANYDSHVAPAGCLYGTRVEIQKQLSEWANDDAPELSTLWLNGMAGTGKTALASTFAREMEDQRILGATFFIDRQRAERRDLRRIVQTLAYDLAKHNHEQLRALWIVLRDDPTFDRLSYQEQVRLLIKSPLDVGRPSTLVIVIDGLDECGASDGVALLRTLITSLTHHPIKLFVTSRNEAEIANGLGVLPHTALSLQDIAVSRDMRLYWEHNLDELCRRESLPNWLDMVSLDELVEITGHLFIYATTLLEIIQDTRTSPIKELVKLLEESRAGTGSAIAFGGQAVNHGPLEKLYLLVLTESVKDKRGNVRPEYALRMHDILEVIIFARELLTPQALSDLLKMNEEELRAYLIPLRSVLVVPDVDDPDGVVHPLHQSFPDFVRQQSGLVHPKLILQLTVGEKRIAERGLCQLNRHLRFDICDIKDASLFNSQVSDLPTRLNRHVSAALRYSCRYWLSHLLEYTRAASLRAQVPDGLDRFCGEHLLHWVEVLSLTGAMNAVQRVMPELISVMNVRIFLSCYLFELISFNCQSHLSWKNVEFRSLLADAYFLMRDYQTPITLSALQVYHSGGVTMPECALRRQVPTHRTVRLISERDHDWQTETTMIEGHTDWVRSVAFSSDGSRMMSGSDDRTVRIWDTISGLVLHTLEGHSHSVSSVNSSSDGSRIASGSDDHAVRIWDSVSGEVLHTLEGHTYSVNSVAFSPDGLRIVSGSDDHTIRVWDVVSGEVLHTMAGHTDKVKSAAFSSDGSRIVSGSRDKSVRIWNAISGVVLRTLKGHTGQVNSVAFSLDASHVVSGSNDETVLIWDAISGSVLHTLKGHTHWVNSVAFSSDNSCVLSGSDDETVRIWNVDIGAVQHIIEGYNRRIDIRYLQAESPLSIGL